MGRLLLVRHGESVWNRDGIVQGQAGPGLSPRGHEQARLLASWLAEEVRDAPIVSSDLPRCLETAAPYAASVGASVTTDVALRERHFGDWQGVPRASIATKHRALWARFVGQEDVIDSVGGESNADLVDRVVPALRRHAAAAPTTVVFTHGGPVWHGTQAVLGVPEGVLGPVGNASVTAVSIEPDDGTRLLGWNAVGHLPREVRTTWERPRAVEPGDGIT